MICRLAGKKQKVLTIALALLLVCSLSVNTSLAAEMATPRSTGTYNNITIEPGKYATLLTIRLYNNNCTLGVTVIDGEPDAELYAVLAYSTGIAGSKTLELDATGTGGVAFVASNPGLYTLKVYNQGSNSVTISGSYYYYDYG